MIGHQAITNNICEFAYVCSRFSQEKLIIPRLVENRFPVVASVVNMINIARKKYHNVVSADPGSPGKNDETGHKIVFCNIIHKS